MPNEDDKSMINGKGQVWPSIGLIAMDMDGTLLTSEKKFLPETLKDLSEAAERGVCLSYATGRAPVEMTDFYEAAPMIRYASCCSGAIITDLKKDEVIYKKEIPSEFFLPLVDVAEKYDGMLTFFTERESIVAASCIHHMADFNMGVYQPMYERISRQVESMREESLKHDYLTKINIYFRNKRDRELGKEELKDLPLTFALAEGSSLEMNAQGVSKGAALRILAEKLGIPMERTAALGDADNDRDMLMTAGVCVAMANGDEDIKALADFVAPENDRNGAGIAIRKLLK